MKSRMFVVASVALLLYLPTDLWAEEVVSFAALERLTEDIVADEPVSFAALDKLCAGCVKGDKCDCKEICECGDECECGREKVKPKLTEPETPVVPVVEDNPPPPPAPSVEPEKVVRSGYPVRPQKNYWSHPGVIGREQLIKHLQQGFHAGKFDPEWLEAMTIDELESLHSDDHDRVLKAHVRIVPQDSVAPVPTTESGLTDLAVVNYNGRPALYRLEVQTRKVCHGNHCTFTKTVVPVFQRWQR